MILLKTADGGNRTRVLRHWKLPLCPLCRNLKHNFLGSTSSPRSGDCSASALGSASSRSSKSFGYASESHLNWFALKVEHWSIGCTYLPTYLPTYVRLSITYSYRYLFYEYFNIPKRRMIHRKQAKMYGLYRRSQKGFNIPRSIWRDNSKKFAV